MYIDINGPYRGITKLEYWGLYKYLWAYDKNSLFKDGSYAYKKASDKLLNEIKRKQ